MVSASFKYCIYTIYTYVTRPAASPLPSICIYPSSMMYTRQRRQSVHKAKTTIIPGWVEPVQPAASTVPALLTLLYIDTCSSQLFTVMKNRDGDPDRIVADLDQKLRIHFEMMRIRFFSKAFSWCNFQTFFALTEIFFFSKNVALLRCLCIKNRKITGREMNLKKNSDCNTASFRV